LQRRAVSKVAGVVGGTVGAWLHCGSKMVSGDYPRVVAQGLVMDYPKSPLNRTPQYAHPVTPVERLVKVTLVNPKTLVVYASSFKLPASYKGLPIAVNFSHCALPRSDV